MGPDRSVYRSLAAAAAFTLFGLVHTAGIAQSFPDRPIRIVIPFAAGGGADIALRALAPEVTSILGQPIVLENRPGAGFRLGVQAMNNAKPDGHTIAMAPDGLVVLQPLADPTFKFEAYKDYAPVVFLFESPLTFAAHPSVPFRDVKGLIAYAKKNPGKLNFAVGVGSATHFIAELFRHGADVDVALIPYKHSNQAQADVLAGQVHMLMSSTVIKQFIESGRLVGIATTGKERWGPFSNLPTLAESGIPVAATVWYSLIAHSATPRETVVKLNTAFNQAQRVPAIQKNFAQVGLVSHPDMTADDLAERIRAEARTWAPVIRKAGLKIGQ